MARLFDDALSEYLSVSAAPITAYPVTMACWFRSDDLTVTQTLISISDTGTEENYVRLLAAGTVAGDPVIAQSADGVVPERRADTTTGYSADTWHHACGVFAASNDRRAYIDGGSKGTDSNAKNFASGVDEITIGRLSRPTPTQYMSGRIAEAVIWNAALNDSEVLALARGINPLHIRPSNIQGYWPVWGIHSPEIDLSPNTNSMTVTGTVKANHAPVTLWTPKWAASAPLIGVAGARSYGFIVGAS